MPKQNQVVAVVAALSSRATDTFTNFKKILGQPQLFNGMHRVYQPRDEEGESLPEEKQIVQRFVEAELQLVAADITRNWDAALTRDVGNTQVRADVKVGDSFLAADLPVPFLLYLGNQLGEIKALLEKLPVLDPSREWSNDDTTTHGYRTEPTQTVRNTKSVEPLVLHQPTERHPAQVTTVEKMTPVGVWLSTQVSGAITERRKRELILRVEELRNAVKQAVEAANAQEVQQWKIGEDIFEWLLRP